MTKKFFLAAALIAVAAVFTACSKDDEENNNPNIVREQPVDLSKLTGDFEAEDGDVLTGTLGGNYYVSIADGATVTLDNAAINGVHNENYKWAGLTCKGTATIVLKGENNIKGFNVTYSGIFVPENKTLTIEGDGSLTASCGTDEFNGAWAAGIGACSTINCGSIVIKGGNITAIGGDSSAGIGGGPAGKCGNITISGGTINASGGDFSAGIGGSTLSECGDITITNTVTSVTAMKGNGAPYSIGPGNEGICGTITIGGEDKGSGITDSPYTYQP